MNQTVSTAPTATLPTGNGLRSDLAVIAEWIAPGTRVLDLGCGDGALLAHLAAARDVRGYGLELDLDNIAACVDRGVNVIQRDLDEGLADFDEGSFDYVVMSQALQVVHAPDRLLREMLRVGRAGIVTFPNFGHWSTRAQLALGGRMPRTRTLPSCWYNTQNIHLCTLRDFEALCAEQQLEILRRAVTDAAHRSRPGLRLWPNLRAEIGMYLLRRARRS